MVKVDLITGFLGSGKTTFIRRYADYLQRHGKKINIIENEFGGVSVDSIILRDQGCDISQISGGCMCCTGKVMFQNMLLDGAAMNYDRILVEPSGIYDVDEFFDVMFTEPVKDCCEIGNIFTIADARFDDTLSDEARYLMFSQLLAAGKLIISKTQLFSEEEIQETLKKINELIAERGCSRVFSDDVCTKNWKDLTDEDFASFEQAGYRISDHEREFMQHGNVFTARVMAGVCKDEADLRERLNRLMNDSSCGKILRIKGHIADTSGNWFEVNCSMDGSYIKPAHIKKGLFIVIGQDIDEAALQNAFLPRKKK
ncbi:MAG: GTP-binding protein [Ruminococcus sp.]|jgi:G3E family GTPase